MFDLTISTPEKVFFKGDVYSLIAPGSDGYLEILTNHAPIITTLKEGEVIIADGGGKQFYYCIKGGVLEVHQNQATLLTDAIEVSAAPHIVVSGLT